MLRVLFSSLIRAIKESFLRLKDTRFTVRTFLARIVDYIESGAYVVTPPVIPGFCLAIIVLLFPETGTSGAVFFTLLAVLIATVSSAEQFKAITNNPSNRRVFGLLFGVGMGTGLANYGLAILAFGPYVEGHTLTTALLLGFFLLGFGVIVSGIFVQHIFEHAPRRKVNSILYPLIYTLLLGVGLALPVPMLLKLTPFSIAAASVLPTLWYGHIGPICHTDEGDNIVNVYAFLLERYLPASFDPDRLGSVDSLSVGLIDREMLRDPFTLVPVGDVLDETAYDL